MRNEGPTASSEHDREPAPPVLIRVTNADRRSVAALLTGSGVHKQAAARASKPAERGFMFIVDRLARLFNRGLMPGDRLRLSIDTEATHEWPTAMQKCEGEVTAVLAVTNAPVAMVVRLDKMVASRGIGSYFVLLHLSSVSQMWRRRGIVDVELVGIACPYQATARPGPERFVAREVKYDRV